VSSSVYRIRGIEDFHFGTRQCWASKLAFLWLPLTNSLMLAANVYRTAKASSLCIDFAAVVYSFAAIGQGQNRDTMPST